MTSTDELIATLKALPDRTTRYAWLDGLDRTERNAVLNRLPAGDRQRYRAHEESRLKANHRRVAEDDAARRREAALAGRATDIADMIEALYTVMPKLTESQREWVERIDRSASASDRRSKFTPRQAEVIRDLYRKRFRKPPR